MIAFVWASRERCEAMRVLMIEQTNIRHYCYGDAMFGIRLQAAILMQPHNTSGDWRQTCSNIKWVLEELPLHLKPGVKVIDGIEDDY